MLLINYMLKFYQNKNTIQILSFSQIEECHMTYFRVKLLLMRKVHLGWDVIFISESEHEFAVDPIWMKYIFICVLNESFTIWTGMSPFGFHVDFNTAAFRRTGADSERRSIIQNQSDTRSTHELKQHKCLQTHTGIKWISSKAQSVRSEASSSFTLRYLRCFGSGVRRLRSSWL